MAVTITPPPGAATYPVGTPYDGSSASPAYSGYFIPTIWAGKLIEKFYDATVLAAIANTDYEGEIRNMGDRVVIRTKPTLTISNYQMDQKLDVERPSSTIVELTIDQGKYWNAVLDDVAEIQSDLNMLSMWADDASEQMKITIDTDVLLFLLNKAAASTNRGNTAGKISGNINLGETTVGAAGTPVTIGATSTDTIDLIVGMGQALDEQNIPETGRWLIIPAWVAALIKRSELRDASLTGDGISMSRNGRLGMIDRFTLYASNLLPANDAGSGSALANGEWALYAGHSHGITFASQLTKMETLRAETTFGTLMRGLQVYGRQVTDSTSLVQAVVVPS